MSYPIFRANLDTAERMAELLKEPTEFNEGDDTLRGRNVTPKLHPADRIPRVSYGRLKVSWRSAVDHATFVVYSYSTPIAWFDPGNGWTMPDERYGSHTIDKHQWKVRRALADILNSGVE